MCIVWFHGCLCCRTNHIDVYVVEQNSGLKVGNLSKVSGKEMHKDAQYLVKHAA